MNQGKPIFKYFILVPTAIDKKNAIEHGWLLKPVFPVGVEKKVGKWKSLIITVDHDGPVVHDLNLTKFPIEGVDIDTIVYLREILAEINGAMAHASQVWEMHQKRIAEQGI